MVPLVVRSHYSLMRGVNSPEDICRRAANLGYDRLALTDTDNLYGLWPFLQACQRSGIIPIVGAELTEPGTEGRAVCLAENKTGYRNLCFLISRRHTDPLFSLASFLARYAARQFEKLYKRTPILPPKGVSHSKSSGVRLMKLNDAILGNSLTFRRKSHRVLLGC